MKTLNLKIKLAIIAILFVITMQAQYHHGPLTQNGSLYFRSESVNNYLKDNKQDRELYYYIHLQGVNKEEGQSIKRIPLNLSLVIDRSGSMNGEKLENTKKAVIHIINQLSSSDILSIVLYDDKISVLLEPQRVENKESIINKIKEVNSGGSTNLEGGIKKGYELIRYSNKLLNDEMVKRVLLLSDGIANVGVTDPVALSNMTNKYFDEDRISISTFGVGLDYNENLMAKIALQGGGMYYFINSPETLSDIFSAELQGISNVVAKNTKLEITFPDSILKYDKTYSYNGVLNGNTLSISFNDIFSKEQKAVLVKFKTLQKVDIPLTIECKLTYTNSINEILVNIKHVEKSEIIIAKDEKQYNSGINKAASEGYALQISGEIYENAVEAAAHEDYKLAREEIIKAKDILETHFYYVGENKYLRSIYEDMCEYEKLIDELKTLSKNKTILNIKTINFNLKREKSKKFRAMSCPAF